MYELMMGSKVNTSTMGNNRGLLVSQLKSIKAFCAVA